MKHNHTMDLNPDQSVALLRIYNSSHEIDTEKLETLAKETYELIITAFPWANITPLHRLLAHCTELIRDCNDGYGLKEYSEEAVEACNKLIRRFREQLSRKNHLLPMSTIL